MFALIFRPAHGVSHNLFEDDFLNGTDIDKLLVRSRGDWSGSDYKMQEFHRFRAVVSVTGQLRAARILLWASNGLPKKIIPVLRRIPRRRWSATGKQFCAFASRSRWFARAIHEQLIDWGRNANVFQWPDIMPYWLWINFPWICGIFLTSPLCNLSISWSCLMIAWSENIIGLHNYTGSLVFYIFPIICSSSTVSLFFLASRR